MAMISPFSGFLFFTSLGGVLSVQF